MVVLLTLTRNTYIYETAENEMSLALEISHRSTGTSHTEAKRLTCLLLSFGSIP